MKKNGKIVLSVLSVLSLLSLAFWVGLYFCSGHSYLYINQEVINDMLVFFAVAILVLAVYVAIIIIMFKSKKAISIVCIILLILSIPASVFGSFVWMLGTGIIGSNGCSYTEDIANYGKYDKHIKYPISLALLPRI